MSTTRIFFNTSALLTLVLACISTHGIAQNNTRSLPWPRTFTGQPDFVFTKEEVAAERVRKGAELGLIFTQPTLKDIFTHSVDASKLLSPLTEPDIIDDSLATAEDIENAEISALENLDEYVTDTNELPDLADEAPVLDLSEFRAHLYKLIDQTVQNATLNEANLNITQELQRIIIQTIALSPQKYAIVNNQRVHEGQKFMLPVTLTTTPETINAVLDKALPPENLLLPETFALYKELRDEVASDYAKTHAISPAAHQITRPLPVTIKAIRHRQIDIKVGNKIHTINVSFAL